MNIMHRIRIYHIVQAFLAVLSFVTGELGVIHAWLGYGVAVVIVFRLFWVLSGERQLGLTRFHPIFTGLTVGNFMAHPAISKTLILGIALSLIGATVTGVALDRGKTFGVATIAAEVIAPAYADGDDKKYAKRKYEREHRDEQDGFVEEAHEALSNLMIFFVVMHAAYMTLFRWPLARFMLFIYRDGSDRTS